MLHALKLLNVSVFGLLSGALELVLHRLELGILFLLDSLNHVDEFLPFHVVVPLNVTLLLVELSLDNADVSFELFVKSPES